jgi:DNA-dependent RNA polymerase auxiliary subunit epsilon
MRARQRGITFLGLLILILVVGTWVYAAIRVVPLYLENMKIASTLEKVRDEYSANPGTTDFMIRKAIERHFDIEMVNAISDRDVLIERKGDTFHVTAAYEATAPFAYNIEFLVTFDKTVEIPVR